MSEPALTERQLALAKASAQTAVRSRAAVAARGQAPWAAGDRVLANATRHLPVEWILLEAHGERPAFLAVPADTCPLAGEADVAVPSGSAAGALCLRCRFAVWLDAGQIGLRAGAIDRATLETARQRLRALPASGAGDGETSLEYRAWIRDVIAPARAAVEPPATAPFHERRTARGWRHPALRMAAALVVFLAGGLLGWLARPPEIAPVAAEPALPPVVLYPLEPLRGEPAPPAQVPRRASRRVVLDLTGVAESPSYEVALYREGNAVPLWRNVGPLEPLDHGLRLELSLRFLPPGTYRFRLFGPRGSSLAEYELRIAPPAGTPG